MRGSGYILQTVLALFSEMSTMTTTGAGDIKSFEVKLALQQCSLSSRHTLLFSFVMGVVTLVESKFVGQRVEGEYR